MLDILKCPEEYVPVLQIDSFQEIESEYLQDLFQETCEKNRHSLYILKDKLAKFQAIL